MEQWEGYGALTAEPFDGFGGCDFWPFRSRLKSLDVSKDLAAFRRAIREECPARPGVYGMVDIHGQLIYVGMSIALRKRLITYFQGGESPRKERCIAAHSERLVWEEVGHELAAELRELELIRRHQPRLNVRGRTRRRPPGFIYISNEPAPRLRIGRRVPKAVRHWWGPLAATWRVREAVELLNRQFKLCDCPPAVPMHFADQGSLFSLDLRPECLRGETGTCLGPCAGLCTRGQYNSQIRATCAFLDGRDDTMLKQLEQQLVEAARLQQYERAARLRDTVDRLTDLCERLAILRQPPLPEKFVYPLQIHRRRVWCFVASDRLVSATATPTDARTAQRSLRLIRRAFEGRAPAIRETDRTVALILSSWFRRHPAELQTLLTPADARRECGVFDRRPAPR
jgi:excinuclease ABC subunit C